MKLKKQDVDPADKINKQNTGWEARMAWITGTVETRKEKGDR